MLINIPRQVVRPKGSATGRVWNYSRNGFRGFIPLILDDYPVEAPTHFRESHGLTNNYVCHGKAVSFSGDPLLFGNATMLYNGEQYIAQASGYLKDTRRDSEGRYSQMWDTCYKYIGAIQRHVPVLGVIVVYVRSRRKGIFYTPNVINGGSILVSYHSCVPSGSRCSFLDTSMTITYNRHSSGLIQYVASSVGDNLPYSRGQVLGVAKIDDSRLFTSQKDCLDYVEDCVMPFARSFLRKGTPPASTAVSNPTRYTCSGALLPNPGKMFLFSEPDDLFLMGPRAYWLNYLRQTAYVDALQKAPKMNDNNLQNIVEVVSFIYNLAVKRKVEIPHSLQDAWLSYRYVYNTGKSDISDAITFMRRTHDLSKISGPLKCYGVSHTTAVEDTDVTCRCSLSLQQKELSQLQRVWDHLATLGLEVNPYVLWDFVPYSFMVDWIIPIGDMLNVTDTFNRFRNSYSINDVCFSLKYRRVDDAGYVYQLYYRWPSSPLQSLNEFYWTEKSDPSAKTTIYRILDTVSLVTS